MTTPDTNTQNASRFKTIVTQRYMYNVERCKAKPLVGWLINVLTMPPIRNRNWNAFLIKTTEATLGVDREDNVVELAPGSEVLIPATFELEQFLMKAATAEDRCFEVQIEADTKIDLDGGNSMWTYKLAANPASQNRRTFGLSAILGKATPQLQAPAITSKGEALSDDIPF